MTTKVTVKCPLGHAFEVDLDEHTPYRVIAKAAEAPEPTEVRTYRFKCPHDGERFLQDYEMPGQTRE